MFIEMFGNQKKTKRYSLIMNQTMTTIFAKKTCRDAEFHPQIVGCLPLEISRFTKFLPDRGVTITATLSTTHYRRSSLVQGGLEIPCVVNAKLIGTKKNKEILAKYLEMVQTHYTEPSSDEDVIIPGFFPGYVC